VGGVGKVDHGGGGGEGGEVNGWTILNTALDKAGDVISNLVRNNGAGPRPRPMVRRPVVPVDSQRPALPEPDGSDNTNPNPESEAVEPMNDLQVGMAMIGEIVKAYSLDPPKEPARVVRMLDQMFRLEKAQRARIVGWKDTAFDIAENQLSDLFAEVPDRRAAFAEWFDQVFDSFTDSTREPKFL